MKFALIGGNPFRSHTGTQTYTALRVVATCETEDQLTDLWYSHYEECGGLMLPIDLATGKEVQIKERS